MFVRMAALRVPARARLFLTFIVPLVVVGMVHDWRTRGRPHQDYVYGLVALLGTMSLIPLLAATPAWMGLARLLEGLGGPAG
jgi:hypothetical protein